MKSDWPLFLSVRKPFAFAAATMLFSCALSAYGSVFYCSGVSESGGWFDTNKGYVPGVFYNTADADKYYKYTDENMCWAATSSNILEYMNAQKGNATVYSSTYGKDSGNALLNSLLKETVQYKSYETFLENFQDTGYTVYDGICWYASGCEAYRYSTNQLSYLLRENAPNGSGGFYQETAGSANWQFQANVLATHYQFLSYGYAGSFMLDAIGEGSVTYTSLFATALEAGPIALGIQSINGGSHAITCWGYETDDNGDLTALLITDSDDGYYGLQRLVAEIIEDTYTNDLTGEIIGVDKILTVSSSSANKVYSYDANGNPVAYSEIEYQPETWWLSDMSSFRNFYTTLNVPEPSTATLSLGAVALMMLRRRRA